MNGSGQASEGVAPSVAIAHARSLLADSPLLAEQQAREVLKALPDDGRALAIVGAARRRMGDLPAARRVLAAVASKRPDVEQAGWELALTLAALGEGREALEILRGLARIPGTTFEWLAAAGEFTLAGDPADAVARAEHLRTMVGGLDARAAADALRAGRPRDAALMIAPVLRRSGEDALALWVMAEADLALGRAAEAANAMGRCVARAPNLPGARVVHARMLLAAGRAEAALRELASSTPDEQARGATNFLIASCRLLLGDAPGAVRATEALVAAQAAYARLWVLHGAALRALGREEEAAAALARAAALRPDRGEAWWRTDAPHGGA